jgi:SAM-dependent methyltransferase
MQTELIQRQYDDVIAPHYDRDPYEVTSRSLDRAVDQLRRRAADPLTAPLRVLDLGMGTGAFLAKLRDHAAYLRPYGIDVSEKMIDIARTRIPGLVAAVDDAANLDGQFEHESFDLVSTHFVTGFVPMAVLAPKIHRRLAVGGYWSFVGGTMAAFPELQKIARGRVGRWLYGGAPLSVGDLVVNPAGRDEIVGTLTSHGYVVRECETFTPGFEFRNLDEFLEFAYYGSWLTPFVEKLGLHRASFLMRVALNLFVFPVRDHHCIEIVLAQKVGA